MGSSEGKGVQNSVCLMWRGPPLFVSGSDDATVKVRVFVSGAMMQWSVRGSGEGQGRLKAVGRRQGKDVQNSVRPVQRGGRCCVCPRRMMGLLMRSRPRHTDT